MSKKITAEFLGTLFLVFFGVGAAVLGTGDGATGNGLTGISLAFGFSIVAAAYGLGAISGAHLNPAVSLGVMLAGRMSVGEFAAYVLSQVAGGIVGALIIWTIASGHTGFDASAGMGQNGFGSGYGGEFGLGAALTFEVVATFIFVTVILGATHAAAPVGFAGLAIGLTLAAIHLVGIRVTGVSVNPARSIGPALFVGGTALAQLWVFIVAPLAGGALAGVVYAMGLTRQD